MRDGGLAVDKMDSLGARVVDHLRQSKVGNLGDPVRGEEHVL